MTSQSLRKANAALHACKQNLFIKYNDNHVKYSKFHEFLSGKTQKIERS